MIFSHFYDTLFIDKSTIKQKIIRLAHEIVEDQFEEEEICFVGILNGGHESAKILKKEILEIKDIKYRVMQGGENPEVILQNEYRLEPDYIWDLL